MEPQKQELKEFAEENMNEKSVEASKKHFEIKDSWHWYCESPVGIKENEDLEIEKISAMMFVQYGQSGMDIKTAYDYYYDLAKKWINERNRRREEKVK